MRSLADEIADRLIQELRNRAAEESSYEEGPGQEMADEAAENGPEKKNRYLPALSQEMSPEEENRTLPVASQKMPVTSKGPSSVTSKGPSSVTSKGPSMEAEVMDSGIQARIGALETQVESLVKRITEAFQGGKGTNLPNLKYAKPKYQNVESLLNYIESKDDEGGVKLVIMNFND